MKSIVDAAVAKGQEEGDKPVVSIAADITTAFKDGARDDRASESTMGNLSPTRCSTHCRPRTAAAPKSAW